MLRDEDDFDGFFEDTMKAGHYENNKDSVEVMIRSSRKIAKELIDYGVDFEQMERNLHLPEREDMEDQGFFTMRI